MKSENHQNSSGQEFTGDATENLRIENEILQLKLKAELGGEFINHSELPPEIENEFLKNIIAFEHAYADVRQVKVYDLLNRPAFRPSAELNDDQLTTALNDVRSLMEEKNVEVHFSGKYDDRTKYKFITEELFMQETDDVQVPGMTRHFTYEEFHPNHKLDIELRAIDFLTDWFGQSMNEYSWELGGQFVLADGRILSRDDVLHKMTTMFAAYRSFLDSRYTIAEVHCAHDEENLRGMGHAEGVVQYKGILESGEEVQFEGPFKLYMSLENGWWSIFYFVFPGFSWD